MKVSILSLLAIDFFIHSLVQQIIQSTCDLLYLVLKILSYTEDKVMEIRVTTAEVRPDGQQKLGGRRRG